mmetsp:Transcript_5473/g.5638  ORF Transcript_5473/g.5638 Transcript_5473/m.5638 type:complete len:134 (-) Transcript_5473:282-683(-)
MSLTTSNPFIAELYNSVPDLDRSLYVDENTTNVPLDSFYSTPLLGLNWLVAQMTTFCLFACVAAWPFFPILVQMRPWPISFSFIFIILLCVLAWVLIWASNTVYSGLLASFLVLLLTGLTAVEYTTSQTQFYI